ncbi:uncharacterized protein LOC124654507 [Lolium rigidum]|uniref:uncharacterized protein LOC124654507 n=1 Tax=Lolium rigidum TaxID=89674 RepID=UPI001F5CB51B|nr:uncharacterized protein LOC124654507 [Lolium rigidum]
MFSVSDVSEDTKKDGLICVIDSTKCPISSALGGYSVLANVQSSEKFIGKMKEKGVEIDWFEVRGKLWSRRRLVLRGGDGMFHLLQWKQHHNTETTGAAAAVTGEAHELPHGNSGASTSGETTQGLGLEMKALIQNVCLQFDQFQATVSIQLSEINSNIQRIDSRVQSIEQQLSSTPTMGSTLTGRQSSSGSGEDKEGV